jgi:hypothetical protein
MCYKNNASRWSSLSCHSVKRIYHAIYNANSLNTSLETISMIYEILIANCICVVRFHSQIVFAIT